MRLAIYDATEKSPLLHLWAAGVRSYKLTGRIDDYLPATCWKEALQWLSTKKGITEVQYWGHGYWGNVKLGDSWLSVADAVDLKESFEPGALLWFRTCMTAGSEQGRRFMRNLADALGCNVAGHTDKIWIWHSGLQIARPGKAPDWWPDAGVKTGTGEYPAKAYWGWPWRERTIGFWRTRIPKKWMRAT